MTDLQNTTIKRLIGKPVSYNKKNLTITKVVPGDGFITVFTTTQNLNFDDNEIQGFIDNLCPPLNLVAVPEEKTDTGMQNAPATPSLKGYTSTKESTFLKDILMDTIKEAKLGTLNPDVAKIVFAGAKAMVEVQKTEIAMYKAVSK